MALNDIAELWSGTVERSPDGITYSAVEKVTAVKVPELTKEMKDQTTLDSPGRVRQHAVSFLAPGTFSISCLYTEAGANAAYADEARTAGTYYRITLSNGDAFTFVAHTTVDIPEMNITDDAMITLSGQVAGVVTRAAASS